MSAEGRESGAEIAPPAGSPAPRARTSSSRAWAIFALGALVLAFPIARAAIRAHTESPAMPVLWQLPDWELVNQDGAPFGARELRGKVYVANFIFTSCVMACPRLTGRMASLARVLHDHADSVKLVSISVDPVNDTPARLRDYASHYHADFSQWNFVTGPHDEVLRAVQEGFKQAVDEPEHGTTGAFNPVELAHSERFALVDARGRLRGAYEVDDAGLARLASDAVALTREH